MNKYFITQMISCHPEANYNPDIPKFVWWVEKILPANPYETKLIKKCKSKAEAEKIAKQLNKKRQNNNWLAEGRII